jgi:hypothetical protein
MPASGWAFMPPPTRTPRNVKLKYPPNSSFGSSAVQPKSWL